MVEVARAGVRQLIVSSRRLGMRDAVRRGAAGCLRPHRFTLLVCPLAGARRRVSPLPGITVDVWDREQLRRWRRGRRDLPLDFFVDEIHGTRACVVARVGDEPAGIVWLYAPGDYRLFDLRDGAAEVNHALVLPPFRRRGLCAAMLVRAQSAARAAGAARVYAAVHAANAPSRRAFESVGFREVTTVRHFLLFRPRHDTGRAPA